MKQVITRNQWVGLSLKAQQRGLHWLADKYENAFTIGLMIEFLNEKQDYQFHIFRRTIDWKVIVGDLEYGKVIPGELCDFLFEAVKQVLEIES